jgi:hypothetical protein
MNNKKRNSETFSRERESNTALKHDFERNRKGLKNIQGISFKLYIFERSHL